MIINPVPVPKQKKPCGYWFKTLNKFVVWKSFNLFKNEIMVKIIKTRLEISLINVNPIAWMNIIKYSFCSIMDTSFMHLRGVAEKMLR